MSINQLFDITRRSFRSLDAAMNTVGQNIANAGTEGYTRRTVSFRADSNASPGIIMGTPFGTATGAGVSIQHYDRVRDGLLAASANEARASLGSAQEQQRLLGALESIFPTGDGSLHSALGNFWDAWATLADNPTDPGVRVALRGQATLLGDTLHRVDRGLARLEEEVSASLSSDVDNVNDILDQIAGLNKTITAGRNRGTPDLAAEDQRDKLVKDLSEIAPVRIREDTGGYTVTIDGMSVLEGEKVMGLELDTSGATPQVLYGGTQVAFNPPAGNDGKLGATLRTLNQTIPETRTALDTLAATLVTEVNAQHSAGYGLDGATGRTFFNPAGTTAASINMSADVLANAGVIAASGDATAQGDNTVALGIANLRTQPLLGGGSETAETFTANLVSGIGSKARTATTAAAGQAAVVDHLDALEAGVSGVSLDEEMTNLIKYQQSFAATARVLDTAQQMMDTLLAL